MIKFMVDMRTCADGATRAAIEELRTVVAGLQAELDGVTGNPLGTSGQVVSSEDVTPRQDEQESGATEAPVAAAKAAAAAKAPAGRRSRKKVGG